MDPILALTIATERRHAFEAVAAAERLAISLRPAATTSRPLRAAAERLARLRPSRSAAAAPCPTC